MAFLFCHGDSGCFETSVGMVYCAAVGCKSNSNNRAIMPTCSFFRIPTEPTLLTKWLAQINRANFKPTKHSRLCSAHFEKSCFGRDPKKMAALGWVGAKVSLKQDAVPTMFPLVEAVLVPPTIRRKRASTTTSLGLGTKSDSKASWSRKQSATASATVSTPPVDSKPTGTSTAMAPSTSTTNRKRQRVKVNEKQIYYINILI